MSPRHPWYQITVLRLVLVVGVCALFSVLLRGVQDAREAVRRSQCVGHLKQLAIALYNYHDANGSFPPAYVADAQGKPMHSWRVLILPFLERADLYNRYNFDEPWDGPNNARLATSNPFTAPTPPTMPSGYACPSHRDYQGTLLTDYVVVTGPGTAFPDAKSMKLADIGDGTSHTLLLVEAADTRIHWMEPRDLDIRTMAMTLNHPRRPGISSRHRGGANVSFCDASIRFLRDSLPPSVLRAYLSANGGERVGVEE